MTGEDADLIGIGLADAIGQVRNELARAIEGGKASPVAFRAGPVELEFEVLDRADRAGCRPVQASLSTTA